MSARPYGGVAADDRRADRRRRLLDAAYDLLAGQGAAAVTVTAVCKNANLTARYFYEHFDNREALLVAVLETEAEAVIAAILEATTTAPDDPHARAVAGITALLDALDADPRRTALRRQADDDLLVLTQAKVARRMADEFAAHAALVLPQAARRPDRAALAAPVIIGGVLQIVGVWLDGQTALTRDEVVDAAVRYTAATGAVLLG